MTDNDHQDREYLHKMRVWEKEAEFRISSDIALMTAQIDFAKIAIKGVTLINGGAALALLAFLGHVVAATAGDGQLNAVGIKISVAADLMPSMILFMGGTVAGVTTAALAYLSQTFFTEGRDAKNMRLTANVLRALAVITATAGIAAFCWGGYMATDAFIAAFPQP